MRVSRPQYALAIACVLALATGCGSTTFTAEEAVDAINDHGGEIALGDPLGAGDQDVELHTITFTGTSEGPSDPHAAGSLMVTEDEDAALAEYQRCESAASLLCFRAANTVFLFEGSVPPEDLARLEGALRRLASE